MATQQYTAVVKQDNGWWIGWIEEVPGVNCQERSREELLETLKITLREALEFNRQEALGAAGGEYEEEQIGVGSGRSCKWKAPAMNGYRLKRKTIVTLRGLARKNRLFRKLLEKSRLAADVLLRE